MNYRFLEPAKSELAEAFIYYNDKKENLGFDFIHEIEKGIVQIIHTPGAWQKLSKNTRRFIIKRFPYGLVYQIRKKEILIVTVMHLKRNPECWKGRV